MAQVSFYRFETSSFLLDSEDGQFPILGRAFQHPQRGLVDTVLLFNDLSVRASKDPAWSTWPLHAVPRTPWPRFHQLCHQVRAKLRSLEFEDALSNDNEWTIMNYQLYNFVLLATKNNSDSKAFKSGICGMLSLGKVAKLFVLRPALCSSIHFISSSIACFPGWNCKDGLVEASRLVACYPCWDVFDWNQWP